MLIGSNYVLEEINTPNRYVVPDVQSADVLWNETVNKSFHNTLKKWRVTVTKSDYEKGLPQGNASLQGAVYGIYQNNQLVDTYTTDINGQFTTDYYICGDDWTLREITPSEGYLLDSTVHHIGAEAINFTVEHNTVVNDVTEQVIKGQISIIKHSDDGSTKIETPEAGAEFQIYLKSAGSYSNAKSTEKNTIVCDEFGFAETKLLPYGIYTVHQTKGLEGRELIGDFDVAVYKNGYVYRYLINNANFASHIKIVKTDSTTNKVIPLAGAAFQIFDPDGKKVTMKYTYPQITEIDTFYTMWHIHSMLNSF